MNHSTTSQFMDKKIMDLSNSRSSGNPDFIDFMNRTSEKKDDIVPSYDFMPIRPAGRSSSPPPPATRSSIFDSGDEDPPLRTWNSSDSRTDASAIRNYSSADADEPAKFTLRKNLKHVDAPSEVSLLAEIDRTIKQHEDNLMHAMEGVSARLTQLETRTHNLEHLVDGLKLSVENTHESTDGKMRQLENILREVQAGVQVIKDKQEMAQAHLHYLPKVEQVENQKTPHTGPTQPVAPHHQQLSGSPTPPPPIFPPPNVPPPPPQQNYQPQVQIPNQYSQNQGPPIPQQDSYFPEQGQTPENPTHQYQLPPPQQQHPPTTNQYLPHHQTPYSQLALPPQSHPSFPAVNSSPKPPSSHYPEEMTYSPSQIYPSGTHQPPPQQFYGPPPSVYDASSSRPGPGYSGPSSGDVDNTYLYSSSGSSYGSGSPRKQHVSSAMGQSGGNSYLQLPTARILPQALPTASGVGAGSGSGNKVPIDDVVDKVTNMGFPRDQVRATVRRLTENGEAVDLNIVLDKLMNGDDQAPRGGWFGR